MAKRHRTRRASGVKTSLRKTVSARRTRRRPTPQTDCHEILGRLSDAMSLIATAARSMAAIEQTHGSLVEPDANIGEELVTLEHGVRALRAAYAEMDVALRAVHS